jgi:hypothetical protein
MDLFSPWSKSTNTSDDQKASPEFFPRHNLAGIFQEQRQDLNGLLRQSDLRAVLRELPRPQIQLKLAKPNCVFSV